MTKHEYEERMKLKELSSKANRLTMQVHSAIERGIVPYEFRVIPPGNINGIKNTLPFLVLDWFGPNDQVDEATDSNSDSIDCESAFASSSESASMFEKVSIIA